MHRREFIGATTVGVVTAAATAAASAVPEPTIPPSHQPVAQGRLKQSVCRWCYGRMDLNELCAAARDLGLRSVELLGEAEWLVPARYGLVCAVANGPTSIADGLNRAELHDRFVAESERLLPLIAAAGIPNMIVFSGNRRGMSDDEGIRNCILGLNRIKPLAERHGVTIIMELLNSRVDHKDYHADRTWWGVEVVKGVGSERCKLLYDIYHMQIMEGDVIRTIRDNAAFIGHYHTGGVPGRREIDDTQELHYPAICRAIADTGFEGYFGQEFIPSRDPIESLRQAVRICTV
ncbi:MAG: TIM barrel protein [Phycisphaeraceae bacterium]|nr:TIM barrel protein [Phycisphaeraceae bacterium]